MLDTGGKMCYYDPVAMRCRAWQPETGQGENRFQWAVFGHYLFLAGSCHGPKIGHRKRFCFSPNSRGESS